MRYHEKSFTYDDDWGTVTSAFWLKYPNPQAQFVRSVDTIARELDTERQTIKQRRLMSLEYQMPGWMEKIFGCKMRGLAIEETFVDLPNKKLTLKSRNIGLASFLISEEHCVYEVDPNDPTKTKYTTSMTVTVSLPHLRDTWGVNSLTGTLENQFLARASEKAKNGLEVMRNKIETTRDLFPLSEWEAQLVQMRERTQVDSVIDDMSRASSDFVDDIARKVDDLARTSEEMRQRSEEIQSHIGEKIRLRSEELGHVRDEIRSGIKKLSNSAEETVEHAHEKVAAMKMRAAMLSFETQREVQREAQLGVFRRFAQRWMPRW